MASADIVTKCEEINRVLGSKYDIVRTDPDDTHVISVYTKTTPPILVADIQWYDDEPGETYIFYVDNHLRGNAEHAGIGRLLIRKIACIAAKDHRRVTFKAVSAEGPDKAAHLYAFYDSMGAKRKGEIINPGSIFEGLFYNTPAENLI